jgi:HKD family nuclease
MKLLTTASDVAKEIQRLLRQCSSVQAAVAWAGVGFHACDLLLKHRRKIEKLVVGTEFYQTHPDFIEQFIDDPRVRFVLDEGPGVFHPKV